jgi:uncharacterized protein YicC (UPF0701 family)
MEYIEDLEKRALRIIWELRATRGNELAEAIKSHRMQRIEEMLQTLKAHAERPNAPAEQRSAASNAIAKIRSSLSANCQNSRPVPR